MLYTHPMYYNAVGLASVASDNVTHDAHYMSQGTDFLGGRSVTAGDRVQPFVKGG